MSSVSALLSPLCSVGTGGGRRAALILPKGVEEGVILAVVAQSDRERGESVGGSREVEVVGEADMVGFCVSGLVDGGDSEET